MADRRKVIIDAGHGGTDPGANYYGRLEKDDVLNLALAVGDILEDNGVEVIYTRLDDTYNTPYEKAVMGNEAEADYFVSLHRNSLPGADNASGVESLVFDNSGLPGMLAENINAALEETGFKNRGVLERPGLVILRWTQMPAVLVEVGFIDDEKDNQLFDMKFREIADSIAEGVLRTIAQEEIPDKEYYHVQAGAYTNRGLADQLLTQLQSEGFPAFLIYEDGLYKIMVGSYEKLDQAANMEKELRNFGYSTFIRKPQTEQIFS